MNIEEILERFETLVFKYMYFNMFAVFVFFLKHRLCVCYTSLFFKYFIGMSFFLFLFFVEHGVNTNHTIVLYKKT